MSCVAIALQWIVCSECKGSYTCSCSTDTIMVKLKQTVPTDLHLVIFKNHYLFIHVLQLRKSILQGEEMK